jgi:hypothetical protein
MTSNDERRESDTYHSRAQADAELELSGRFKKEVTTQVIGKAPLPRYPRQPSPSPFAGDPVPPPAPLGISVNEMPPVGEAFETVAHPPTVDDSLSRQPLVRKRV